MKCRIRSVCLPFCLLSLFTTCIIADATFTVYGIAPAAEGDFLTEPFQHLSITAGTDGLITVIDNSATDEFTAHGTYGVTLIESSNGLVFHASGSQYSEEMSCAIDTRLSSAACVFTETISGSTIINSIFPTQLPVIALVTAVASSSSKAPSQTSSPSPSQPQPTSNSSNQASNSTSGLAKGALIGIIIAVVIIVIIIACIAIIILRRRRRQERRLMQEAADVEKFELARPVTSPMLVTDAGSSTGTPTNETSSSSAADEKRRRAFFAANPDQNRSRRPMDGQSTVTSTSLSQDDSTDVDPRQIMEEMRRMREEVASLRTNAQTLPPEYSE